MATNNTTHQKQVTELIEAARILVDHAREVYPHFEVERGQVDIRRVADALDALTSAQNGTQD